MMETIFEEWGIIQKYGLYKGWFWWDDRLNKWSKDIDKFQERLKNLNQGDSKCDDCT